MTSRLHAFFPWLAVLGCVIAYTWPQLFTPMRSWIVYLLGAVMFFMGCTLEIENFKRAISRTQILLLALALQFSIMPFVAWQLANLANLSVALTTGMLLVGCAPGGTASNVMCYLSKGDVALSIILTTLSTILAVIFTPLLTYIYLNEVIEVPIVKMAISIFYIIILPISAGLLLNRYLAFLSHPIKQYGADCSIVIICLIIAIIVALNHDQIQSLTGVLFVIVILHSLIGFILGYLCTYYFTRNVTTSRTIAIEVGMQNSGLSAALAVKFYVSVVALPAAIFSITQNIIGSLLASYWVKK